MDFGGVSVFMVCTPGRAARRKHGGAMNSRESVKRAVPDHSQFFSARPGDQLTFSRFVFI